MSYTTWFIRSVGLWGLLQLLVGASIFVWAVQQAIRVPEIRLLGIHGAVLLVPFIIGLLQGAFDLVPLFELVHALEGRLTPGQILHDVVLMLVRPLDDALVVTIPAALVLTIAWLFPMRRRVI